MYLLIKTQYRETDRNRVLKTEKKSWEEITACIEKFEVETERENVLRVSKWVLWDIMSFIYL